MKLILDGISKAYRHILVFQNISASVSGGECLGVAGPNGSGKTTLLRLVCGLTTPTSGSIFIEHDGKKLSPLEAHHLMGVLMDDYELYYELSALENLSFFARLRGIETSSQRLQALLERFGLGGAEHQWIGFFSSGMKQRLKLAFALMSEPKILILDEPTANLDEQGRALVHQVLQEHKQRGGLIILATNDERELTYADKLVRLGKASAGSGG